MFEYESLSDADPERQNRSKLSHNSPEGMQIDVHDDRVCFHSGFQFQHPIRIYTIGYNTGSFDDKNNGNLHVKFVQCLSINPNRMLILKARMEAYSLIILWGWVNDPHVCQYPQES